MLLELSLILAVASLPPVQAVGLAVPFPSSEERGAAAGDGLSEVSMPELGPVKLWLLTVPFQEPADVEILVEVDPRGRVREAHFQGSEPKAAARGLEEIVRSWVFQASADDQGAEYRVHVRLEGTRVTDAQAPGFHARYESPLTLHLYKVVPETLLLPRTGGRVVEARCPKHHARMQVRVVPVRYGLLSGISKRPNHQERLLQKYWRAQVRRFPNAAVPVRRGCIVRAQTQAERMVCPVCEGLRQLWLQRHPGISP